MPKLLEYIKECGISHEEVMKLIKENLDKPESETEEPDVEDTKDKPNDKPDQETKTSEDEVEEEAEDEEVDEEEPDVKKLVEEEVAKQIKIKRKKPSRGKTQPDMLPELSIKKNWFEEIV